MINFKVRVFVLGSLLSLLSLGLGQEDGQEVEGATPPPRVEPESERTSPNTDVFIPSEEIAADEEVIFPIDI